MGARAVKSICESGRGGAGRQMGSANRKRDRHMSAPLRAAGRGIGTIRAAGLPIALTSPPVNRGPIRCAVIQTESTDAAFGFFSRFGRFGQTADTSANTDDHGDECLSARVPCAMTSPATAPTRQRRPYNRLSHYTLWWWS